jgi:hypothetical protein
MAPKFLFTALLLAATALSAADRWNIGYFYDKPEENLDIADVECPAAGHCFAAGALEVEDKYKPYAVITADGGAHWTAVHLTDLPTSLFFRDGDIGWMAAEKGIWQTHDGGQGWKKISSEHDVRRLFFVDENRGFALQGLKLLQTSNGGSSWQEVQAVRTELEKNPSEVVLEWLNFTDARNGELIGEMTPEGANRVPAWLEPPRGRPSGRATDVIVMGRTTDGGASWKFSSVPRTDDLVDVVFRPGRDTWFIFQPGGAESRSEIARFNEKTKQMDVVLRDTEALLAGAIEAGSETLVAAIARQGRLLNLPVPGKLRFYSGPDFQSMDHVDSDYRAIARRGQFASDGRGVVLFATDTGMILKLTRTAEH